MKNNLNRFKGKTVKIKVKDSVKNGKNVYKNIKGHANEINTVLTDMKTGLKKIDVAMNVIYPGKVNKEYKMTRGHRHNADEVYIFLSGNGKLFINKKSFKAKKGDLFTVPRNSWHRAVNTGRSKLVFLTIFGKHGQNHLKKY